MFKRFLLIFVVAIAALGFGATAHQPQSASAACAVWAQTPYVSGSTQWARGQFTNCAGKTVQVCLQYISNPSATYGCSAATYINSNSPTGVWGQGIIWGTARSWVWVSGMGVFYSVWSG